MVHSMESLFSLYFGILRPSWSNYKAFIGHVREVYGRTQLAILYPSHPEDIISNDILWVPHD